MYLVQCFDRLQIHQIPFPSWQFGLNCVQCCAVYCSVIRWLPCDCVSSCTLLHRTELSLWKGLYNLKQFFFFNISIYIRTASWWFSAQNSLTIPALPAYLSFFPFPFCHTLVIRICIRFVWQVWFIPLAEWFSIWTWENPPPWSFKKDFFIYFF